MRYLKILFLLFLAAASCAHPDKPFYDPDVSITQTGDSIVLNNGRVRFSYSLRSGTFDINDLSNKNISLTGLAASAFSVGDPDDGKGTVESMTSITPWGVRYSTADSGVDLDWRTESVEEKQLGPGVARALVLDVGGKGQLPITLRVAATGDSPVLLLDFSVANTGTTDIYITGLEAAATEGEGSVRFSRSREDLRILHNGSDKFFDFFVNLVPGDKSVPGNAINAFVSENSSVSNYSAAYYDLADKSGVVIGFTSFLRSIPTITTAYTDEAEGTGSFNIFAASSVFEPVKILKPGESIATERLRIELGPSSIFDKLESWALAVKAENNIKLWTEKYPEIGVPNGWNSWSGSGGSGGYGTDIDQDLILDNLEFAAQKLKPWGMDWFQVDDGWQKKTGDWTENRERFPEGLRWLSDRIRDRGFRPGLWISGFVADDDSELFLTRPGLFAPKSALGEILVDEKWEILDLSSDVTNDFLFSTYNKISDAWNFDWVKFDFGYWAMLADQFADRSVTREQAYRKALATVREAIGDDTFLVSVGLVGLNFDVADSMRLTLDTMPSWEDEAGENFSIDGQGIKPTYRAAARRYYLHNHIWINHNDLIFFRPHSDPNVPPLTMQETICQLTFIGMFGGIVKIGDRLVDLSDEAVKNLGRIMPIYGDTARPLDLFEREYPEILSLPVVAEDESYHVLALINWGENRDMTVSGYPVLPEAEHEYILDRRQLGLDPDRDYLASEFWSGEYYGRVGDALVSTVAPRRTKVFAIREVPKTPQVVGSNRHLLQGVIEIVEQKWNAEKRSLNVLVKSVPGFRQKVSFFIPSRFEFIDYFTDGGQSESEENGEIREIVFTGKGELTTLSLRFATR